MNKFRSIILVGALAFATTAMAKSVTISEISVNGNNRIETATITSNLSVKAGDEFDDKRLDEVVHELFETGYFADANADLEGSKLVINVVENPIINKVAFEGNKEIEDKVLREVVRLKPRQVYTVTKLKADTKTLFDLYRIKGHFGAKVTPKIVKRDQNRVDVVFEITEGETTKVRKVGFIGNKAFSERKLEEVIQTKESRWYRFFTSDDSYDADRMAYDQELLRRFYLHEGYADFNVKSAVAELTPDQKEFFITFTIDEGERYKVSKAAVSSKVPNLSDETLQGALTISEGDWYNSDEVDASIEKLTAVLGEKGYAFVDIRPSPEKSKENKTIALTFEIHEGPKVFIERIQINGNIRTDEDVIRRELAVFEGDAYNAQRIKMSERRLRNLGFFKNVKVEQKPTGSADRVDLNITVEEEDSTGELWVAGGYSTLDGVIGDIGIRERNLLGRGQDLNTKFTISKKKKAVVLGFTEPYFMDRKLSAGFDVFYSTSKSLFDSNFTHDRTGANFRIGYNITEYLSQGWNYTIRTDRVSGIHANVSSFLLQQKGSATTSLVGHTLVYDKRDDIQAPTRGYYVGTTNQFAGLGGNVRYLKNDVYGGYFIPVADDWVLGLSASGGAMEGLGKKVRITDRYSMGDIGSLRGFRASGVEPRDKIFNDPLGGLRYYLTTAELEFPIGLPNEFGVKGAVFSELGANWKPEEPKAMVFSSSAPRATVGAGLSWKSPMGPLRVDFAKAVRKEKFDRTKSVHFGFSTRF